MPDMRISEDTVLLIARLANEAEDMKDAANEALKGAWSDYRENLKALGLKGKEVSAEVGQLKAAIAEVRLTETDRDKRESKAEGIDGYVAILSAPRARARKAAAVTTQNPSISGDLDEDSAEAVSKRIAALKANPAMSIVDAGEIKKSEPQLAPQAGSDLTTSHAPNGQVADIPEPDATPAGAVVAETSGVTGAATSTAPMYAEPGIITWESCPPEPVERHEYSAAFGDLGQDIEVITEDMEQARSEPIVKVGNKILDGWARYMKARELGIEYPVMQYDGHDWLVDCIKWNVAGRILTNQHKQIIAKRLIALYPQRKGPILAVLAGEDIGV